MKNYHSYKQSGIEWIGEIPEHWNVGRVKHLVDKRKYYQIGDGDHGSIKPEMYCERGIPYLRVQNLSWDGQINKGGLVYISEDVHEKNLKSKLILDDILIAKTGATIGKLGIIGEEIGESNTTSSVGKITINKEKFIPKFFLYFFQSNFFQKMIWIKGIEKSAQPGFNIDDLVEFPILLLNLQEQTNIVQFLDEKTEILDKLISTKEQKIELLKEQRTSLIHQVITKGLDPNVKLRDSGVDWIGEIPEHWETKPLKYVINCNEKVLPENTDPNYELNYIEISDVDNSGNINNITPFLFKDCPSRCRRILSKGDVIVSSVRTYLKSIGYIKEDVENLICSTGFCVLTPQKRILSEFLFYQVLTEYFIGEVISRSEGVSYPSITSTEMINIKILLPSLSEQKGIVEYIQIQTNEIDDLVSMEQKKIDLLKEYRQSLISEVVTGKIDVRTNVK